MAPLKILISGGGVAGTALAFWLSKLPYTQITVVEHFPSLRTTGLQIDVRGPGIEVLRRMGLEQAFRERAAPEEGMQFVDSQGRNRAYMAARKDGKAAQGITSEFEIMRGDLCRLFHDATPRQQCKYVFGTSVASFKESEKGEGVEVTFKNGETESFDLVIGAEGNHSTTRKLMLGGTDTAFNSVGKTSAYLTIPKPIEKGERYVGTMYLATGQRGLLVRRHSPTAIQLYLLLERPDQRIQQVRRGDVEAEKAAFAEIFRDAGWRAPELLQAMQHSDDFYAERVGIVKMNSWYQGHVALVGDAAYGPGGSGMGTSTAMIGAYVLAGEIGRHCKEQQNADGLAAALRSYDQTFRPYMNEIHKGLDSSVASWLMPSSSWGIFIFHYLLEFFILFLWDPIMQFHSNQKEDFWKLPLYEELI